jgi:hypothetical protein
VQHLLQVRRVVLLGSSGVSVHFASSASSIASPRPAASSSSCAAAARSAARK